MGIYFSKLSNSHFPHEIYVHDILLMLNKFLYFNICLVPCSFVEFMKKSSFHVKHVCNIDPSNGNAYIVNSKRKEFNWRIQYDLASNFCRFVIIILLPQLPKLHLLWISLNDKFCGKNVHYYYYHSTASIESIANQWIDDKFVISVHCPANQMKIQWLIHAGKRINVISYERY